MWRRSGGRGGRGRGDIDRLGMHFFSWLGGDVIINVCMDGMAQSEYFWVLDNLLLFP